MNKELKQIDVTALGELLIDFTESGMSSQGNRMLEVNPGGAPCNVLSMLTKLGHSTAFIGKVGKDMFGDLLEDTLKEVGIGTEGLLRDDTVHTTLAFVHTKAGGDREFSFYRNPGADMMLTRADVNEELIHRARIFHFGTLSMTHEACREATKAAIRTAREADCLISFDPNLREPLWDSLEDARQQVDYGLRQCEILKISDNEIQWFTGETDFDRGLEKLQAEYRISLILLSLGREGSRAVCGEADVFVPAVLNPATVETTGAGDTFGACVLHYVLDHCSGREDLSFTGDQLREMLQFANAAASIITTRKGALKVMPSRQEIEEVLAAAYL
ncbi:MAG: carbohydrate kinase [Parasporobacterium sp.]|nr:carbohydrate kinase [Parasporobacterium sp.]